VEATRFSSKEEASRTAAELVLSGTSGFCVVEEVWIEEVDAHV
jgi:hypothetical protein